MYSATPKLRLSMYDIGSEVKIDEQQLIVTAIREDGFYELSNKKGRLVMTVSPGHEVNK